MDAEAGHQLVEALELEAEVILMAKREYDGVYSADPELEPGAEFIPASSELFLGFTSTLKENLGPSRIANLETLGLARIPQGYFTHGSQGGKRRAQFVRRIRSKPAQFLKQLVTLLGFSS